MTGGTLPPNRRLKLTTPVSNECRWQPELPSDRLTFVNLSSDAAV